MALFKKHEVLRLIEEQGFIPLFFHDDANANDQVAECCFSSGSRLLEFTNRGKGALQLFQRLVEKCRIISPEFAIGAGSITDKNTAMSFVDAGADFIVGPSFCEEIADYCNNQGILYVPGCATLNEILHAEKSGMTLIKVFPASCVGGASFIKSILAPCPWLKLMPTGGVSTQDAELREWFDAGVTAVGLGSNVISKQLIVNQEYGKISSALSSVSGIIRDIRKQRT